MMGGGGLQQPFCVHEVISGHTDMTEQMIKVGHRVGESLHQPWTTFLLVSCVRKKYIPVFESIVVGSYISCTKMQF